MTKEEILSLLENIKYAPSFMGGSARYQSATDSGTIYEQDIQAIKDYIEKEWLENARRWKA